MELTVLNTGFVAVGIVDSVSSIIWIERYSGYGEVEIYVNFSLEMYSLLQEDFYLINKDSDKVMVIETITIKTDPENGNKLLIRGRSLSSVLDRRIIIRQTILDTSLQTAIQTLLTQNVISGIYPERDIPGFTFSASADPLVTTPTLKGQFYYDNLYDVIQNLCDQASLGFKVVLDSSNHMVFSLYAGKDRSYAQITNPYVVFSPNFDNLIKSDYFHSRRYKKNYVLLRGDPQSAPAGSPGFPLRGQTWTSDVGTGLNRREMFIDASDMSIYVEGTSTRISDADYLIQLAQRGQEELANFPDLTIFDGEVDLSNSYKYNVDFGLGDIVQLADEYGHVARCRVIEMTLSEDLQGSKTIPTLKTI